MIASADTEITRMKRIVAEIDHLEGECEKVCRIRDTIRELRRRVDDMDKKIDHTRIAGARRR